MQVGIDFKAFGSFDYIIYDEFATEEKEKQSFSIQESFTHCHGRVMGNIRGALTTRLQSQYQVSPF